MSALLSQFQCKVWSPIPHIERMNCARRMNKIKHYDSCPIIFKAKLCSNNVNTFFPSFHPPAGHLLRVLQDVDFGASDQIIRVILQRQVAASCTSQNMPTNPSWAASLQSLSALDKASMIFHAIPAWSAGSSRSNLHSNLSVLYKEA